MNLNKYENYKKLTPEQKEEYEFYFGKPYATAKYKFDINNFLDLITRFMIGIIMFSIFILMMYKLDIFDKTFIITMNNAIFSIFKILKYGIGLVIFLMILERLNFIIEYVKFSKKIKQEVKQK